MNATGRFRQRRRDRRPLALALVGLSVLLLGLAINHFPSKQRNANEWPSSRIEQAPLTQSQLPVEDQTRPEPKQASTLTPSLADDPRRQRLDMHFQQAVVMLHAREYQHALVALQQVLEIAPNMPEAHVNAGYAMLGLEQYEQAAAAFLHAIDLRPEQANAYYGLAVALDAQGDRMGALGAMYSFLHRASEDDPYRRKAAAALWEWESQRERGVETESQLSGPVVGQEDVAAEH